MARRVNRREEIRRLLLEPAPASAAVIGAYERLQRAAEAAGIVLRPLEREPVFGPLVQTLARVEALLDRPIQGRDVGRDVGGEQEIATLDPERGAAGAGAGAAGSGGAAHPAGPGAGGGRDAAAGPAGRGRAKRPTGAAPAGAGRGAAAHRGGGAHHPQQSGAQRDGRGGAGG